jgi:hypothetical protein
MKPDYNEIERDRDIVAAAKLQMEPFRASPVAAFNEAFGRLRGKHIDTLLARCRELEERVEKLAGLLDRGRRTTAT